MYMLFFISSKFCHRFHFFPLFILPMTFFENRGIQLAHSGSVYILKAFIVFLNLQIFDGLFGL